MTVYKPDDVTTSAGMLLSNKHKNRYPDLLPCKHILYYINIISLLDDHRRVKLVMSNNEIQSDYINASYIVSLYYSYCMLYNDRLIQILIFPNT